MTPTERILSKLPDAKKTAKGWSARCPAHEDRRASLSITQGDNGGAVLHCHAGCEPAAVVAALGLTLADIMPPRAEPAGKAKGNGKPRIVATYDYRDEAGNVLFQVVRYDPKDFRQRRPKPGGGWDWSVKGVRVVPYHLPQLLAEPTRAVAVVEGEKDVDNLARIGVLATCNAGGAGKWTAEHSQYLAGRPVIVLADNDERGPKTCPASRRVTPRHREAGADRRTARLAAQGRRKRLDCVRRNKRGIERLIDATPEWTPTETPKPGPILTCLADVEPRPVSWLWPGAFPWVESLCLSAGPVRESHF